MNIVEKTLSKIENCILQNKFEQLETDKIELKSLHSSDDWTELYKSVCAFLNAEGGIVIIGIKEKDKKYIFSGYKGEQSEEEKLKELPKKFSDDKKNIINLQEFFPKFEIKEFSTGKVCVIYIEKLPEDQKYVFYHEQAYKRKLTGDHKLSKDEIESQKQRKYELTYARELMPIENAGLEELDVDKLNDYITRLNRTVKIESLKADIVSAKSFLLRKGFITKELAPTLLGMLVCGNHVEDWLSGRCQVDAYVDSAIEVARNKQILKDNVLILMEKSIGFVYQNIQIGVSRLNSGTALPEYPQNLIEETINNALAHRNYHSDKFVLINIKPNESIEIRNPGEFLPEHLLRLENPKIRRIVPIAKARNPRLADLLKTYDRYEGRNKGMATLTNTCLDNEADVPYFILRYEEISLYLNKGKVYDDEMETWMNSFAGYILKKYGRELSGEEKIVMSYFYKSEKLNRLDRYTILLSPDNNHAGVIAELEEKGLIFRYKQENEIYPIYLVDRELILTDFSKELIQIFGGKFNNLPLIAQKILAVIYQYNKYAMPNETVSANSVGNFIFLNEHKIITDLKIYENFKRKVRTIFNKLEEGAFIVRKNEKKADFEINKNFKRTPSIFDKE
jgi:predicted HTH transcriptional regulator